MTGNISGVISERDYISKIALLGKKSRETKIKEISTKSANLLVASPHDSVDECMAKMLSKDIRHLPLMDDDGKVIGMLSVSSFGNLLCVCPCLALHSNENTSFTGEGSRESFSCRERPDNQGSI